MFDDVTSQLGIVVSFYGSLFFISPSLRTIYKEKEKEKKRSSYSLKVTIYSNNLFS